MDSPPMATFASRRAPNVSQYIAELNVVRPEPDDALAADDAYDFETNLNLFTNAEFLDYPVDDIALDQSVLDYPPSQEEQGTRASFVAKEEYPHGLDFVNNSYRYAGMTDLMASDAVSPNPTAPTHPAYAPGTLPVPFDATNLNFDPSVYNAPGSQASTSLPPTPTTGTSLGSEEAAKAAAEEDKRRRNTAASARFRVKKKQREQALEKREKDLSEKMSALQKRVGQLEQENKFLRSLVTEKNGKEDLAERYQKFRRSSEEAAASERSPQQTRKGVGTKSLGKA